MVLHIMPLCPYVHVHYVHYAVDIRCKKMEGLTFSLMNLGDTQ